MPAKQLVEIEVSVELGGRTTIEAKGFVGDACLKETKSLEEALGKVENRSMKTDALKKGTVADKTKITT